MASKQFKLSVPVTVDGTTYEILHIRALRFGDLESLFGAKNEIEAMKILLARLADVPQAVISSLEIDDVGQLLGGLGDDAQKIADRLPG
ncbi:phage tail assembly protein [Shinella yambaruensis]|uniref:Phage tail assembly protein n=1 Tax=Shinella yambaruensis TaxID=415996 RepID=A0ABQ5ZF33_9HYPH|nr:phage tail assembly protein [Shinella yambaruensis]MCJ8028257.1 phage tail assembly protein [Shinella yambaruensis]MCU7980261.1 phage tail assembly protein [Shinella yambaruensis]GLR49222.1 hypothetical protein GCM10007923_04270 [Shinella yambaruensis]